MFWYDLNFDVYFLNKIIYIIIINRYYKDINLYYDKNIKILFKYESNIRNVVCVLCV